MAGGFAFDNYYFGRVDHPATQIVLFGAEYTQVYALKFGSGLKSVTGLTPADPNNPTGAGAAAFPNGPEATPEPVI